MKQYEQKKKYEDAVRRGDMLRRQQGSWEPQDWVDPPDTLRARDPHRWNP